MTKEEFETRLAEKKSRPPRLEQLVNTKPVEIITMCAAWANCSVKCDYEKYKINLWECSFNVDKFIADCGILTVGLFMTLINANILYPDGTYNKLVVSKLERRRK